MLIVVVAAAALACLFIRVPYDLVAPGSTRQVNDLVVVRGAPTYAPRGRILYTTVSVRERVTPYEVLYGWIDPNTSVEPERDIRGSVPPKQFERLNVELMSESKRTAELVALHHLNIEAGHGAKVETVDRAFPASSVLQAQDVIVAIDGKKIALADDLVAALRPHKPGDHIRLDVQRGSGAPQTLDAVLGGQPNRAMLGVRVSTDVKVPFTVNIDSGQVVGPSAGVAYSLELLDQLTPGELTAGRRVAITGELGSKGEVLPVGGVAQKTVSVRRSGAQVFLVPKDNYKEAKAHAGNKLRIYAVTSVDDAIRVLHSLGGQGG